MYASYALLCRKPIMLLMGKVRSSPLTNDFVILQFRSARPARRDMRNKRMQGRCIAVRLSLTYCRPISVRTLSWNATSKAIWLNRTSRSEDIRIEVSTFAPRQTLPRNSGPRPCYWLRFDSFNKVDGSSYTLKGLLIWVPRLERTWAAITIRVAICLGKRGSQDGSPCPYASIN